MPVSPPESQTGNKNSNDLENMVESSGVLNGTEDKCVENTQDSTQKHSRLSKDFDTLTQGLNVSTNLSLDPEFTVELASGKRR